MDHFHYRNNQLFVEEVNITTIAQQWGTPAYIYSRAALKQAWQEFSIAFGHHPHLICYAVKANSNLAVLNILARLGSGFDVVSVGELERVIAAGGNPRQVVFSGVGKQDAEIRRALEVDILCFNVESEAELLRINHIAGELGKQAPISLRINPDVDAGTHPYIATGLKENKFGIEISSAIKTFQIAQALPHVKILGLDCHIGSQLTDLKPFLDALDRLLHLIDELKTQGIELQHLDVGGGLGVRYAHEQPPIPSQYVTALLNKLQGRAVEIILEPGRAIAANAGILLTRVEYIKTTPHKNFAIIDAAMNDLMRPALYDAWQNIIPVQLPPEAAKPLCYDVVGPVCETGDFLGKNRELVLQAGDLLAICSAGAYGFVMSSNYNSRPRAIEIMVDKDQIHVIRSRETIPELFAHETILK